MPRYIKRYHITKSNGLLYLYVQYAKFRIGTFQAPQFNLNKRNSLDRLRLDFMKKNPSLYSVHFPNFDRPRITPKCMFALHRMGRKPINYHGMYKIVVSMCHK